MGQAIEKCCRHLGIAEHAGPLADAEVIVADISTQRHWTRDLEVSRDGHRLFVSIGSASTVAQTMPEKTPDEIKAHEETQGLGAAGAMRR